MIIQEGRYYRARNGVIYGPLANHPESHQPFWCKITNEFWMKNGSYYSNGTNSNLDLLSEVNLVMVDPFYDLVATNATPKVDRVVLASKILPRLVPDLVPSMAARQALQYADAFLKEIEND